MSSPQSKRRARNDPEQYEDLASAWWDPSGPFVMLHWIAAARARLIPPVARPGALVVDIGCGGGLLAPHLEGTGYTHIGVDLSPTALALARNHGVRPVRADAGVLPFADGVADVVVAGEILEHVTDLAGVVAEACRILCVGGTFVIDTIADTRLAKVLVVTIAERIPNGAPPGIHDPDLFVDRERLIDVCAEHGVDLTLTGLRPTARALFGRGAGSSGCTMTRTRSTAVLFQGVGVKQ